MCEWSWERIREVLRIFCFDPFSYDSLCIYIHTWQYQCNHCLNCNEQYKKWIIHDSNILRESNHNKSKNNINHLQ